MIARIGALLVILAASPRAAASAPAEAPTDPLREARRLFNARGPLAGAEYAAAAFPRPDLPRATRLRLGLFASNSYALVYQADPAEPPGDPDYLCRALAMLAAAEKLATEPGELEAHRRLVDERRGALEKNHPGLRCDHEGEAAGSAVPVAPPEAAPASEPASEPASGPAKVESAVEPTQAVEPAAPVSAPEPAPTVPPSSSDAVLRRRAATWTAIGGASLGLAVVSFAAMGGALARREELRQSADGYYATTPGRLTPEQARVIADEQSSFSRVDRMAVATGVVGGVMAITGIAMVAHGAVLRGRIRLAPDIRPDRAALVLSGRF